MSRGSRFLGGAGDWHLQRLGVWCWCAASPALPLFALSPEMWSVPWWGFSVRTGLRKHIPPHPRNQFTSPWTLKPFYAASRASRKTCYWIQLHGFLSTDCWSCQQSCFLLTSRVAAVRSGLSSAPLLDCAGVSRAVEWIDAADTHNGDDWPPQEERGHGDVLAALGKYSSVLTRPSCQ